MNEVIYLKKTGFYIKSRGKRIKILEPLSRYLKHTPKIERNFKVLDLMQLFKLYQDEIDLLFLSYTRGFKLEPFLKEISTPTEVDDNEPITTIEFSWVADVDNFKEFGKPAYEISEYIHLTGRKSLEDENYGLAFVNLYDLRNATLTLNENIEYSTYEHGELWEDKKIIKHIFLKARKAFTLENIIGNFLMEITYFGYPSDRDQQSEKLVAMSEDRDTSSYTPHEEVLLEWKEEELASCLKKKESKLRSLKIEKLNREIAFLKNKLIEINAKKKN